MILFAMDMCLTKKTPPFASSNAASKVSSGLVSKLKIKNLQPTPVGYKFKTNAPLRYSVKPVLGVLVPGQSIEVFVRCESWVNPQDRFLLQSVGLTEEESQYIDATTWKELDRRRIIESFIQCSSSSTLTMREPQDDGGSISSTSSNSSTRSSVVSSTRSSSGLSDKSRELRSQQQQAVRSNNRSPLVSTAKLQGRKMSSSSATSSNSSSPGSYPTLFQAKQPTNATKTETKSRDLKEKDLASTHAPLALFAAPVHYLHTKVSNSKQTVRTLTRFLAVRQYTKMQVFTVSMVCLLLGLLLPMEKLMMMLGGNSMQNHASSGPTAIPKALFSGVSPLASPLSQKPPVIVVPVSQRPKVVSPVMEEEEAAPPTTVYLPKVEDLLAQDGPSSQEAIEPEPIGAL
ncbi:Motile sperm domain-containing protein 2 [Haplosporangium bisporale]|nr:Motile sperm domain-containing protein 2 [Haplosporangium bisporale]